ncbi:hypothetical protein TI05_03095 [Achromatium sp. WMS3]|nr:hypothetical protein TI05_03095 [Achromatium sp. WMS3]
MSVYFYLFETQSIQSYILNTNQLKEISGASELLESITGDILQDTLKTVCGDKNLITHARYSSGTFYAFSDNAQAMEKFTALWPLIVRQYAPDLSFVQAQGQGDTYYNAYRNALGKLLVMRNSPVARLPQAPPMAERCRRTGEVAVGWHDTIKNTENIEAIDAATLRKLDKKLWTGENLIKRLAPDAPWYAWPLDLNSQYTKNTPNQHQFPFLKTERNLALVHANGNNLWQLLNSLEEFGHKSPNLYTEIFNACSTAIMAATEKATQIATQLVLEPKQQDGIYPARPIVLGGDDITILIRSDLALNFTRCFLQQFTKQNDIMLLKVKVKFPNLKLPQPRTACAGILYAKANHPLHTLHELTIDLCQHAKKLSKIQDSENVPTSISWHRITTVLVDNYEAILKQELTLGNLRHTLECYALEKDQGLAALDDLLKLRTLLTPFDSTQSKFSKGAIGELAGLIGHDATQTTRQYKRWRERFRQRSPEKLAQFDSLLMELGITQASGDLPYSGSKTSKLRSTAIGDLMTLKAVGDTCHIQIAEGAKTCVAN